MKNKRAQVFSLILVFITLFMCITSYYIYTIQQKSVESSLVSPLTVLQIRDDLEVFEMREKKLIEKSLDEVGEEFREKFIEGVIKDEKMKEFILGDLTLNGKVLDSSEFDEDSFFRNGLYSDVVNQNGKLVFSRNKIGKSISLSANNKTKVNFPVDFKFEFEREYLITKKDGKFEVEAV